MILHLSLISLILIFDYIYFSDADFVDVVTFLTFDYFNIGWAAVDAIDVFIAFANYFVFSVFLLPVSDSFNFLFADFCLLLILCH